MEIALFALTLMDNHARTLIVSIRIMMYTTIISSIDGPSSFASGPDFERSRLEGVPETIEPWTPFTFRVVVENTGDTSDASIIRVPLDDFLLISHDQDSPLTWDWKDHDLESSGPVKAGAKFTTEVTVLPVNNPLSFCDVHLHISTPPNGTAGDAQHIDIGAAPGSHSRRGIGYLVLASIGCYLVLKVIRRRRGEIGKTSTESAGIGCGVICIVVWMLCVLSMSNVIREDIRMYTAYQASMASILDGRRLSTSLLITTPLRSAGFGPGRRPTGNSATLALLVRHVVDGKPVVAVATAPQSRLGTWWKSADNQLARLLREREIPIWYDPEHPDRAVYSRRFGMGYIILLILTPLAVFGTICIVREFRGESKLAARKSIPLERARNTKRTRRKP